MSLQRDRKRKKEREVATANLSDDEARRLRGEAILQTTQDNRNREGDRKGSKRKGKQRRG